MSITRDDVARIARVSAATVSRVFNTPELVSPDTAGKVRAAAARSGYRPNKFASALRRASSGTVMFLEPKQGPVSENERYYLWFYADVIRAVAAVIDSSMFSLTLQSIGPDRNISDITENNRPAGIICHQITDSRILKRIERAGIPYVACYRLDSPSCNCVYIDEVHGGRIVGQHLADTGHTDPAHITGRLGTCLPCSQRWEGFRSVFREEPYLVDGELGIEGGYRSGLMLAEAAASRRIDCVFVVNDLTAVGVIQALQESGIRIPEDISVTGYDNLPFTASLPFRLATADILLHEAYRKASIRLLECMRSGGTTIRESIKPVLVPGNSVVER